MTTSPDLSAQPEPTPAAGDEVTVAASEAKRIRRPRDMALSLAILLVPILLIIGIGRFFYGDTTTATVDPQLALQGAGRASMQPIPAAIAPDGWKIVSAQFKDGVLRIGYVDKSNEGVQLVQGTALDLVNSELGDDARPAGDVSAAGQTWSKWDARNGISALTRKAGPTTIIIMGTVPSDELTALAEAATAR